MTDVDAAQALQDLTELSSQIEAAVLFSGGGDPIASTLADETRGKALADAARRLLDAADETLSDGEQLAQLEASTLEGSVFVVRDGQRAIAATTGPEPTVGLVFYDLKTALRNAQQDEKPKRKPRKKADAAT